ncbi:hypothetical protein NM208_g7489 [Fusarium decemcellulare]|nr:hypothetical protein NM208_g7489 [Fusarium decemcellulare]
MFETFTHPKPDSRVLRPLGRVERYQSALHLLDLYPSTIVTCHYRIPQQLAGPPHHSQLETFWEAAVARNVLLHPMMQVGIVNEDSTKPSWIRLDTLDLSRHISWRTIADSEDYPSARQNILEEQLRTKFYDLDIRPGWRMVLLRHGSDNLIEAILAWNHPHFDGTGAKIFHETMLETLNKCSDNKSLSNLKGHMLETHVNKQNLPPPQEIAGNYSVSFEYAADTIWEELKPKLLGWLSKAPTAWPPIRATPYATRFRTITVNNTMLQGVLSACRAHKTTLTGLLHAIALISLTPLVPEAEVSEVTGSTPLNLRRFIPARSEAFPDLEPEKTMNCCVTSTYHKFDHDLMVHIRSRLSTVSADEKMTACADIMWEVAARVRDELRDKLNHGLKNDKVGMMGFVDDWREYAKEALHKPRSATWLITNLGVLDGKGCSKRANDWTIERANFLLAADVPGEAFSICPVAVKGKELTINVDWQGGVVDDKMGDQLVADIERCMMHLAKPA